MRFASEWNPAFSLPAGLIGLTLLLSSCGGSAPATRVTYGGTGRVTIDADQSVDVTATVTPLAPATYSLSGPGTLASQHSIVGELESYYPPSGISAPVTVTVTASAGGSSASGTITVNPSIVFGPQTLPGATVGTAYSATFSATRGTGTLSYAVVTGSLPPGLLLAATGAISGTPTASGTYTCTVRVQDQADTPVQKQQTVSIVAN